MLNSEIQRLSTGFPPGFRRDYDAHVYYGPAGRDSAVALRARAARDFHGAPVFVGDLVDRCVGPHPLPMFEINFPEEWKERVCDWLSRHRAGHTVLVHRVTGYDLSDHTDGATWMGEPVALDHTKLDPDPA